MEQYVKTLEKSADKLAEKAETTHSHKLIMELNAIRRSVKKKKEEDKWQSVIHFLTRYKLI